MEQLLSTLKVAANDLSYIHRNVYGPEFFSAHEVIEEYYQFLWEMADELIEISIGMGYKEPTLEEAVLNVKSIDLKPMNVEDSFAATREILLNILKEFDVVLPDLPHDVKDQITDYYYKIRKEVDYKIAQRLALNEER